MTTTTPTRPDFRTQSNDAPQWWLEMRPLEHRVLLTTLIVVIASAVLYGLAQSIKVVDDFAANIITEVISIAITVTVIERLNRQEAVRQRKEELILQMGSTDNAFAKEAVRLLGLFGWLYDGSLQERVFVEANLHRVNLMEADLQDTWFMEANLTEAEFYHAKLQKANMSKADLQGAALWHSNLKGTTLIRTKFHGANLREANLRGAYLLNTEFDEETTLPDNTKWSLDVDMKKFTDPDHPEFWQPDWVKSEQSTTPD